MYDQYLSDTRFVTNVTDVTVNVMLPVLKDSDKACCTFSVHHLVLDPCVLEPGCYEVNEQEYEYGVLHYSKAPCTESVLGLGYHLMIHLKKVPWSYFEPVVPLCPPQTYIPDDIIRTMCLFLDLPTAFLFLQSSKRMNALVRSNSIFWHMRYEQMKRKHSADPAQPYSPCTDWYNQCKTHNYELARPLCLVRAFMKLTSFSP